MMTTKNNYYCKDDIIISVPTKTASNSKHQPPQIDISTLNEDDLKLLKSQDPFLYHSIPSVNKAKLTIKPINHTQVIQDVSATTLESSAVISRRTRVSTECHATLILDDLMAMDGVFSTDDHHRRSHAATSEPAADLEDMMRLLVDLDDDSIISDHTCLEQ